MKRIVYSSPFVPAEWIAAHGLEPSRIVPRESMGAPAAGVCPFAQALHETLCAERDASAAILATTCDQMRRTTELLARECSLPLFLLNVPATWQSPAAYRMYLSEIRRLGRFLVQQGGEPPTEEDLARHLKEHDAARQELLSRRGQMTAARFARELVAFQRGNGFAGVQDAGIPGGGVPLSLVGGPLLERDLAIFDLAAERGGEIVLNATNNGERMLPLPLDRRRLREDPLDELARIYFTGLPDAFRRPNSELYRWLDRELKNREVRGIVYRRYPWCDFWHAEVSRLRDWTDLPVLEVDSFGENGRLPFISGKLESFLEAFR